MASINAAQKLDFLWSLELANDISLCGDRRFFFADTAFHAAPEEVRANIAAAFEEMSNAVKIHNVHSVRVRATPDGMVVNYHCRLSPRLTVSEVHARVDELDRKMREAFPDIVRIVGHAEPMRE